MALTTVITGFITVAELRSAIGKPTLDTADPGYVSDEELERIIQRHHDEAVERARVMADERIMAGDLPASKRVFNPVAISMSTSATQVDLREGNIGSTYYPFVYQVTDESGKEYVYDDNPGKTTRTSFTKRFVYKTVGRKIYASPTNTINLTEPTTLNVHLALENDVWDFLFDGEMVRQYNNAILQEAITLMDRAIGEGQRLEQIFQSDDGFIGDLS